MLIFFRKALSIVRHSIQSKVNIIKDKADCQAMVSQYPRPEYSIDPLKITDQMLCAAGSSDNQICFVSCSLLYTAVSISLKEQI